MLTADQLRQVLGSAELRRDWSLELPEPSLAVLLSDQAQFDDFYQRWSAQGQPKYVPPAAAAAAPEPAAPAPVTPAPAAPEPAAPEPAAPQPVAPSFAAPAPTPARSPVPTPVPPVAPTAAPPLNAVPPIPIPPPGAAAEFATPSPMTSPPAPYGQTSFGQGPAPVQAAPPSFPNPYGQSGFTPPPAAYAPVARPSGIHRPGLIPMIWGFGVALVGVVITVVTYETTAAGGTFVVAWGSMIFGTIRGITGLVTFVRNN